MIPVEESFEVFFRREYRPVLGLAIVLSGNRTGAEDVTMDAFEAALRNWQSVSRLDSPGAWVRRVVANRSVSRFRRLAVEARAALRIGRREDLVVADGDGHFEVWEAVRRLPRRQAQVVALFYLEGYPRAEVARTLGISEESVKTHLERARRNLDEELSDADN
ncbi:MAG: sigma-70 family RNA polymerase sigma factor [Actinobacteria bacterium]|nr:sigma-70 family RNA polymerase sigma factor [Actinomycetota bacterium]